MTTTIIIKTSEELPTSITRDFVRELKKVKSQLSTLKAQEKKMVDTIKEEYNKTGRDLWQFTDMKVTVSTRHNNHFDSESFKRDYPELYEKYLVSSETLTVNAK